MVEICPYCGSDNTEIKFGRNPANDFVNLPVVYCCGDCISSFYKNWITRYIYRKDKQHNKEECDKL